MGGDVGPSGDSWRPVSRVTHSWVAGPFCAPFRGLGRAARPTTGHAGGIPAIFPEPGTGSRSTNLRTRDLAPGGPRPVAGSDRHPLVRGEPGRAARARHPPPRRAARRTAGGDHPPPATPSPGAMGVMDQITAPKIDRIAPQVIDQIARSLFDHCAARTPPAGRGNASQLIKLKDLRGLDHYIPL